MATWMIDNQEFRGYLVFPQIQSLDFLMNLHTTYDW